MNFDGNFNKPVVKGMLEMIWGKFEYGPCSEYNWPPTVK